MERPRLSPSLPGTLKRIVPLLLGAGLAAFGAPALAAGDGPDIDALEARSRVACPAVWEALERAIDPGAADGDVWQGDAADRDAFIAFIEAELGAGAPDAAGLAALADDVASVAAECATARLALLDGLIERLPGDALAAMEAVSEGLESGARALTRDGFLVGDIRVTGRPEPAEGWVFLVGQRIGGPGSGADLEGEDYAELFELARTWHPNSGSEDFAAGDIVALPDLRGRLIAGLDAMGGIAAGVLTDPAATVVGGVAGHQTHTLTVDQMPSHDHGMSSAGKHSHGYTDVATGGGSSIASGSGRGDSSVSRTTSSTGNHTHDIHATGGGQPHPIVQPTVFFHVEMKYR